MALPVNAQVGAAPNFAANLQQAQAFFAAQDAQTAPDRMDRLKAELREMKALLAWSPASGRTARFLSGRSVQARVKAAALVQLAQEILVQHIPFLACGSPAQRLADVDLLCFVEFVPQRDIGRNKLLTLFVCKWGISIIVIDK